MSEMASEMMVDEAPRIRKLQVYAPYTKPSTPVGFRLTGRVHEEQVIQAIRKWFYEKPVDGRVITRGVLEGLVDRPSEVSMLQFRKELTAICNKWFTKYSPNTKTLSWKINAEDLA